MGESLAPGETPAWLHHIGSIGLYLVNLRPIWALFDSISELPPTVLYNLFSPDQAWCIA
jgi:hypothetical protein